MYVVKYKQMVVMGIIPWNSQYIIDVFRVRYRKTVEVPYDEPSIESFPLKLSDDITIYPAEENREREINPLFEAYHGPTWEFLKEKVIAHYTVVQHNLDTVKENYRKIAANLRYAKEISGTSIKIDEVDYFIKTFRDEKYKYVEKLSALEDNQTINWKFGDNNWKTLTKSQILSILRAIDAHVQSSFDYELNLNNQINSAQSIEELMSIEELNKPQLMLSL